MKLSPRLAASLAILGACSNAATTPAGSGASTAAGGASSSGSQATTSATGGAVTTSGQGGKGGGASGSSGATSTGGQGGGASSSTTTTGASSTSGTGTGGGGSCEHCAQAISAPQGATPCAGTSAQLFNAAKTCICTGACAASCAGKSQLCGGAESPAGCIMCESNVQTGCGTAWQACIADH